MTPDEIRKKLNLKTPRRHELEAIRRNLESKLDLLTDDMAHECFYRMTGRTTNVLVDALAAHAEGKHVILKADTDKMEHYMYMLFCRYAQELGIFEPSRAGRAGKTYHLAIDHPRP